MYFTLTLCVFSVLHECNKVPPGNDCQTTRVSAWHVSSVSLLIYCNDTSVCFSHRMGFHINEATCYLTADLFYVEVLLLPCGAVQEVKVASHGESPAVS